jgi:hypothetical protein
MFVLHICKCTVETDADGIVATMIHHESVPMDSTWCLVTYRNTARYPAYRVDHFDSFEEACAGLERIEPTVPLISLGGRSPDVPLTYEEFAAWKTKEGLRDYDYKYVFGLRHER